MHGDQHPSRVALREARESTIDQLSDSFARDELSLEEFESRLDRAYAAANETEVRALVSDLSVAHSAPMRVEAVSPKARVASEPVAPQALARVDQPKVALAVFGNVERHGRWAVGPRSRALAVFGNAELDLRDAIIEQGITQLEVKAIFGNVEIIVPPHLCVECHGASIFGNFESLDRLPQEPDGTPTLRVTGKAIFGNVEIRTEVRGQRRLPGHRG